MTFMYAHSPRRTTTLASALMAGIASIALTAGGALAQDDAANTGDTSETQTQTPTNLGSETETSTGTGSDSGQTAATGTDAKSGSGDDSEQTAATTGTESGTKTGNGMNADAATEFYDEDSEPAPSFGEGMTGETARAGSGDATGTDMAEGDETHRTQKLHSLSELAGQGDLPPGTILMIVPDGAARGMIDQWQGQGQNQNQQTAQGGTGQDQQNQAWAQRREDRMMQRFQRMLDQQDAIDAEEFRRDQGQRGQGQQMGQMGNMGQRFGQMQMDQGQMNQGQMAQRGPGMERYRQYRSDRLSQLDENYARWRANQLAEMDRSYQEWRDNFRDRLDQSYMAQREQQQRDQMQRGMDNQQQMGMRGSDLQFYDPRTGTMIDPDMAYILPDGRVVIDSMPHIPGIQPEQLSER